MDLDFRILKDLVLKYLNLTEKPTSKTARAGIESRIRNSNITGEDLLEILVDIEGRYDQIITNWEEKYKEIYY